MKKIVLITLCLLSATLIFANKVNDGDNKTIKGNFTSTQIQGKVIDKITGEDLAGVKIQIEGNENVFYTDFNGNFTIENVSDENVNIDISYISYKQNKLKEIKTNSSNINIKVELEPSVSSEEF